MQHLSPLKSKQVKTLFLVFFVPLILSFSVTMAFAQSNERTTLKVNKSENTSISYSEMSPFNSDLRLGKAFFLTLDISNFGNIEELDIAVLVDSHKEIAVLFKGEIGRLSQDDTITLPIYLNLDLPEGHSSILVSMTFKDIKGRPFHINDSVNAYLQ